MFNKYLVWCCCTLEVVDISNKTENLVSERLSYAIVERISSEAQHAVTGSDMVLDRISDMVSLC